MEKRKFSAEQIEELLCNQHVTKCSEKAITYAPNFKVWAVRQYHEEGNTANEIFREAGFDMSVIGSYTPKECLGNWRRIYQELGVEGLLVERRGRGGGRPKTKGVTEADRIKRLEAEVAYLKAENDFLVKLRAKRAE